MIEYTDQQFLYKAVPVDYDGAAKLKRIKGNTLVFNQLIPITATASATTSNITVTNNNDGSLTLNGTPSNMNINWWIWGNYATNVSILSLKASHKYFVKDCNLYRETGAELLTQYIGASPVIWSPSADYELGGVRVAHGDTNKTYANVKVYPMLIDLTKMGLDSITSAEEFTSLFPLPYYSYQSTLLPFKGTSIKTTGANLLNSFEQGTIDPWSVEGSAFPAPSDTRVRTPLIYLEKGEYTITSKNGFPAVIDIYRSNAYNTYDIDVSFPTWQTTPKTFTMPYDGYVVILFRRTDNTNITPSDITGEWMYNNNTESVADLPTLNYFPTGMKSAGNVYDELTESKAITRVGMVDLGSLTWALNDATNHIFEATITDMNPMANYQNNFNFASSMYTPSVLGKADMPNLSVRQASNNSNHIFLKNTSYTDATTFKSAMSGVYLYYELATETETDADAEIIYRFYQYGTEQIIPVNGATPTTAPIIADIEYYNQIESETPYRKFWLVNGNGERWDLTEKELKSFLENPQGLGFQKTIDVTRYGERAYKNTESYNFPQVTGDVLFYDSANSTRYEKYNEFVRFLMEQPITLHYMIPVSYNSLIADTYSLECEVMSLTKTESKTDRILTSNIQMNGLGFYEGDEIEINGTANTLTINNKGDFPVGFEIELRGTYKNPYFTLEQNGELYGEAKFDDNANNFSSVFVNSKDGEQNVVLKQNNSIMPNPLAYQDLSISNGSIYVTFVKLVKGESTLTIGGDSYTISGYTIRYTPIYRSV